MLHHHPSFSDVLVFRMKCVSMKWMRIEEEAVFFSLMSWWWGLFHAEMPVTSVHPWSLFHYYYYWIFISKSVSCLTLIHNILSPSFVSLHEICFTCMKCRAIKRLLPAPLMLIHLIVIRMRVKKRQFDYTGDSLFNWNWICLHLFTDDANVFVTQSSSWIIIFSQSCRSLDVFDHSFKRCGFDRPFHDISWWSTQVLDDQMRSSLHQQKGQT